MPTLSLPLHYRIRPVNPFAHRFEITCTVVEPNLGGQRFALPAWIPGSYMIRDFARHILTIRAEVGGRPVRLEKIDKHTWQAAPLKEGSILSVAYEVYAWDLSVRAAHLDQTHGFFNGSSVFLRVIDQEDLPCLVDILAPQGQEFKGWRVATSLEPAHGERGCAKPHGFGLYRAGNYDELIDHPVEMGTFALATFEACGASHEIAVTGRHDCDMKRLAVDLKRICEWQIRLFGEPAPMSRYVFLVTAVGDGYGGLEHRSSTALLCSRNDLPHPGMTGLPESYRAFLGLCSHEYFHTWNVKRIKPVDFIPYDLDRENYTTQLWAFEGITSYYDDLALLRSGVIALPDWLEQVAKTISSVYRTPGRLCQSLAESSFDAWIKFYRPDENTPNSVVNYYSKGALVALALDLMLRHKTKGKVTLDNVIREIWRRFGQTGTGLGEDDIRKIAEELSGIDLKRFFAQAVHGTADLPLKELLVPFGILLEWEAMKTPSLGIKTQTDGKDLRIIHVYDEGPAQRAGIGAGDILLAINGLRVTPLSMDRQLSRFRPGEKISIHAFRRDELMIFSVRLDPPQVETVKLIAKKTPNALRESWLGC